MAWGMFINGLIAAVINAFPNSKLLNYSLMEQIRDIIPSVVNAILMGVIIVIIGVNIEQDILKITTQIIIGGLVYFFNARIFKLEALMYLIRAFKQLMRRGDFNE